VRIDGETKKKAARVLDKMGLSISDAVRCVLACHLLVAIEKTLHDQGLHIS
jgi:addiction module RelB/DinJ family antitoxin